MAVTVVKSPIIWHGGAFESGVIDLIRDGLAAVGQSRIYTNLKAILDYVIGKLFDNEERTRDRAGHHLPGPEGRERVPVAHHAHARGVVGRLVHGTDHAGVHRPDGAGVAAGDSVGDSDRWRRHAGRDLVVELLLRHRCRDDGVRDQQPRSDHQWRLGRCFRHHPDADHV